MEPRASLILRKCSATELHLSPFVKNHCFQTRSRRVAWSGLELASSCLGLLSPPWSCSSESDFRSESSCVRTGRDATICDSRTQRQEGQVTQRSGRRQPVWPGPRGLLCGPHQEPRACLASSVPGRLLGIQAAGPGLGMGAWQQAAAMGARQEARCASEAVTMGPHSTMHWCHLWLPPTGSQPGNQQVPNRNNVGDTGSPSLGSPPPPDLVSSNPGASAAL